MFGEAESNYFCEMVQLPPALNPHTSPPAALNLVSLTQSRYSAFTISASKNKFGKKPMICTVFLYFECIKSADILAGQCSLMKSQRC